MAHKLFKINVNQLIEFTEWQDCQKVSHYSTLHITLMNYLIELNMRLIFNKT